MALTGDHYVGTYEGHTIELVRNDWSKTLTFLIDRKEVASKSSILPGRISLSGVLDYDGYRRTVVAKIVPRYLLWTKDIIEVDGNELTLKKIK